MNKMTQKRASLLFGALAHPTRLRMVELLEQGERTVNELAEEIGIAQSSASQHLAILTRVGILTFEPRGAARLYKVRGPRIPRIVCLIEEFCQIHSLYGDGEQMEDIDNVAALPDADTPSLPLRAKE